MRVVAAGGERLDLDERTLADVFKAAGYATGAFGKWHNGTQSPHHPNDRDFHECYGFCSGHWGSYFDPDLDHNGRPVRGKGYLTDDLTDHALDFIERNRDRPFLCYLPYNAPHSPMQVPDRFYDPFRETELARRARDPKSEDIPKARAALAMCENIDWNVGRILRRLDALKLAKNMIVVYFSDNGPNGARWNGDMRGVKGSTDEGGVHSPLLVRWPGRIPAGARIPQIAGAIDLLPTLADLAGVPLETYKSLDGVSLKPLLLGEHADWPERMIFSHWNGRVSVRTQQIRLDHAGKLYDTVADPGQRRDIASERPEVAEQLVRAVARWRDEVLSELGKEDRPFTVGYSVATPLPARDGVPHGGIKRSAGAPNCSFFTNWTSPDDRLRWDIEVAEPGRYEVVIHYTCPGDDFGSAVELSFGENRVEGKVAKAHDPPLRGAENDRVLRHGESYVKDFRPLRLGVLEMASGRGQLTLRALEVPGETIMDVRQVVLTRLADE